MRLKTTAIVIIGDNGTFLGTSRKNDHNMWGFPGGKTEKGESTIQCACRELEEETGLHATSMNLIDVRDYDNVYVNPISQDEVWLYKVNTFTGQPRSDEESIALGEGLVKWVTEAELIAGPFGDYNEVILQMMKDRKII